MIDFESNTGLVYDTFNRKFQYARHIEEDLIQEGMIALWHACERFDTSKGVAFSTFATKCIFNAMAAFLRKYSSQTANCVSLDALLKEGSTATLADLAAAASEEEFRKKLLIDEILDIAKETPYFKLLSMKLEGKSQAQIAKELGMKPCRVSEQLNSLYKYVRTKLEIE